MAPGGAPTGREAWARGTRATMSRGRFRAGLVGVAVAGLAVGCATDDSLKDVRGQLSQHEIQLQQVQQSLVGQLSEGARRAEKSEQDLKPLGDRLRVQEQQATQLKAEVERLANAQADQR